MKTFKWFLDLDNEEKWLNVMLKEGYLVCDKKITYLFSRATDEDKEKVIRLDYRLFTSKSAYTEYVQLMRDCGWSYLAGSQSSGKHYFIQNMTNGETELFSTKESKQLRYLPLLKTCGASFVTFAFFILTIIQTQEFRVLDIFNPKKFYFTPGLWELNGASFLYAFLFETPFALLRGYSWLIMMFITIYYGIQAHYAQHQLKRSTENDETIAY